MHMIKGRDKMFENYRIEQGDTLESIANRFHVPMAEILRINGLENIYELQPGQILRIPVGNESAFEVYQIQKGDTLYSLAQKYHTTPELLTELNGLEPNAYLYAGETLLVPKEGIELYLTEYGDSIQKIATLKEIDPNDILIYNDKIYLLPEQIIAYRRINGE